jgi:hypothetical protein
MLARRDRMLPRRKLTLSLLPTLLIMLGRLLLEWQSISSCGTGCKFGDGQVNENIGIKWGSEIVYT